MKLFHLDTSMVMEALKIFTLRATAELNRIKIELDLEASKEAALRGNEAKSMFLANMR